MVDLIAHPGLVAIFGGLVLAVIPRAVRPFAFIAVTVAAGAALLSLGPDASWTATFYGYELDLLRVDGLSRAFSTIFALAAVLGGVYGYRIMGATEQIGALVYAGGALGVVLAGDLITLFIFWELKASASLALIWARRAPASRAAGWRYILVHIVGGTVLLAGIGLHVADTGSTAFVGFDPTPAAYVVLVGVALSAAIPPLHAWLADAYPAGTVAGAVFLSAFTTKAAVYTLARGFEGFDLLVPLGVFMALYGVVYAVLENDIRRLLAYHIVSQVGYMVTAVGMGGEAGVNGATAHAFAHILYKGLLFMGAGAVLYSTGKDRLTQLGGIARRMPLVVTFYMIGAFSISGFPLFSGFVSKELIVETAYGGDQYVVYWLLKLASVGTFLHTGLKLPYFTWFGPDRGTDVRPIPASMIAAMGLTAAVNVAIGLVPGTFYELLPFPVDYEPYSATKVAETSQLLAFTALGFWLYLEKLGGEPTITLDTDWVYRRLPGRVAGSFPTGALARWRGRIAGGAAALRASTGRVIGAPQAVGYGRFEGRRDPPEAPFPLWLGGVIVVGTFVLLLTPWVIR
jgi:multicomponent Na+:H+ antiporter subunit D